MVKPKGLLVGTGPKSPAREKGSLMLQGKHLPERGKCSLGDDDGNILHDDDPSERASRAAPGRKKKCGAYIALDPVVVAVGLACVVCKMATRGLWVEASLIRRHFECVGAFANGIGFVVFEILRRHQ